MAKRIVMWAVVVVVLSLSCVGIFVGYQAAVYGRSMETVYEVAPTSHVRSTDPLVIARGKHLADSITGCSALLCHGSDLSGGAGIELGPVGKLFGPNITPAGQVAHYSDGELGRLILHGVNRDRRSLTFMPVQDFNWLPDDEITAIISYVRSVPAVSKPDGVSSVGLLGKVLDRLGKFDLDVARRVDHQHRFTAPTPAPTAAYGAYVSRLCVGCHGAHLSGGPLPGAPPSVPIPKNITPHETGIKAYSFDDFSRLLDTGVKRDGSKLDPFMPLEALSKMDDLERHAIWAYLESVPPTPFGNR